MHGTILVLLLIFLFHSLNGLDHARKAGHNVLDSISRISEHKPNERGMAKRLYPEDLMQRQLATYLTSIPKLFHQSWINDTLPAKFEEWSSSCRAAHPDWEWVLWTDEDNRRLVERDAPWFIDTYESLQSEIYRADAARNMYMHVFGG